MTRVEAADADADVYAGEALELYQHPCGGLHAFVAIANSSICQGSDMRGFACFRRVVNPAFLGGQANHRLLLYVGRLTKTDPALELSAALSTSSYGCKPLSCILTASSLYCIINRL